MGFQSCRNVFKIFLTRLGKNIEFYYRVTNVVGDTVFVEFSIIIVPLALAGGDFIN